MISYFGYGAMSRPEAIKDVIGRLPTGTPGTAQHMQLCVQHLADLPQATQEVLRQKWPADFRSYTLAPREGSTVVGVVWSITPEERKMIEKWELVETDWYNVADVQVLLTDGQTITATTEVMGPNQSYSSEIAGEQYQQLLNNESDRARVTSEVREENLKEGNAPNQF